MKRVLLLAITCWFALSIQAQSAKELQETARSFTSQGDFSNAILVLNRAAAIAPQDLDIQKDLALNFYFLKDNNRALEIMKPLLDREDADDQCYQITGNIYKQLEQAKECDKLYRKGIKRFPESGALYNDLGELLWAQKDYNAIKQWEKGIEVDPNFPKNYYNASKYYYFTPDKVWSVIYGEVFVNMEPASNRTAELKTILLESYKKLFAEADPNKAAAAKGFAGAFLQTMAKQSALVTTGVNPESLTMIRTRFILDWFADHANKYPFRLFEHQRHLLREGLFDAYNQWIFGAAQNPAAYQNWTQLNSQAHQELARFQRGRTFKLPTGQYYQ